ncbi:MULTISPECIES: hypothetical protein [Leptolyngbya]|uniref:hypothetical protein n=1 Tax=Leptolyngbya TaxID=47251 RepID=UPI001684FD5F|nr:hypothetical protein [Leptolyngbya sp. FACHB-1624]
MFASITDSQGNLVTVIDWKVVTLDNGKMHDLFIDRNDNIYLERPHNDTIDAIELINCLRVGLNNFYQMQGLQIHLGRTT